jgi:hypothetical protein
VGVALVPIGGFLVTEFEGESVRRVGADGIISTAVSDVAGSGAIAALPDGDFVVAEYGRVRRVAPDGTVSTLAGTNRRGFSGDGGPATAARVAPDSIAVAVDGSVLIGGARRVRRVAPNGIIATVAGNGRLETSGDGGPAVRAGISAVNGVAALPDGGFVIVDGFADRVRRVSPAGLITTFIGPRAFTDFAEREAYDMGVLADAPHAISVAPDGLLIGTSNSIFFAPTAAPLRPAVRIVGARTTGRRSALVVNATQPATLTVRGPGISRRPANAIAGRNTLALGRPRGVRRLRVTLDTGTGIATDAVTLVLGGHLPKTLVRRALDDLLSDYAGREFDGFGSGPCRRFGRRRVDCVFAGFIDDKVVCQTVMAARVGSDGVVRAREYRCPRRGERTHRRRPHYLDRPFVLDVR